MTQVFFKCRPLTRDAYVFVLKRIIFIQNLERFSVTSSTLSFSHLYTFCRVNINMF